MSKMTKPNKYKYDVAISLCKEDLDFAKRLVKAINPTVNFFFYSDRQEDLISKSGPEAFAKAFKEESRIVVILYRDDWSKSFYTEIERNAIVDRTKDSGYQFLMVLPMISGEIPPWYPSTQIYASPQSFSVEELAHFIEFKLADEGGTVKNPTLEDRYQNLLDRIDEKKAVINLQHQNVALDRARSEMKLFKQCFNKKSEFLNKSIFDKTAWYPFSDHANSSYIGIGEYLLECRFSLPDELYIVTTQDFGVTFELFKIFGDATNRKSLEIEQHVFFYTPEIQGWAIPHLYEQATNKELQVLFRNRDNSKFYDLKNIVRTSSIIDLWFQKMLSRSSEKIERYI